MLLAMDSEPNPAILAAIEAGRGQRGQGNPDTWTRHRAKVLTLAQSGLELGRLGEELEMSERQVDLMLEEACDALLQSGAGSPEADAVCARKWRRRCRIGIAAACARLSRGSRAPV